MSMKKYNPTETELEILQILWEFGPSTVRFINDKQNELKKVGYTTTLKIMQIMVEKGLLTVDKANRQHIYTPLIEQENAKKNLVNNFLDKTFKGSATQTKFRAPQPSSHVAGLGKSGE